MAEPISMAAFMAYSTAMSLAQGAAASDASKAGELKRLSALTDEEINTMFAGEPGAAPITDAQPPVVPGGPVPAVASIGSSLGGSTPSTPAAVPGGGRDFTTVVPPIPAAELAKTDAANAATDLADAGGQGGGTGPDALFQGLLSLAQIAASSQRQPPRGTAPFQGQAPAIGSPFARQAGTAQQPGIRSIGDILKGAV